LSFGTSSNTNPTIDIDTTTQYQTVDGFGYTLTGGSAQLINDMIANDRANLLNELFGNGANSIGISYLRVSLGASDLSSAVFSYNDLPSGQTDPTLAQFSLSFDTVNVVPVLKQILAINPNIKILASPWSAPVWMKDNNSSIGGSLLPQYYSVYAQYFVKYIQAMKARGITIDAVTVQNEP
ncbi:MAG TPA: glucosylceramidase, partial [Chitinophagaceae bacterium]|nr:glucosylceramidase [Chitinophagaceae bacterium]